MMPMIYLCVRSKPSKWQLQSVTSPIRAYKLMPLLALIFIVYATSLAGVGLGMSGETIRVFSAFKLVKPVGLVFLGLMLGSWTDPLEFIDITSRVYGVIVGLTTLCTVTSPEFPMGEWGKYIFEYDLSGYPNSAMSFYACLVPLLIASADISKERSMQLVGWGLAGCSALMILGSMSRSSSLALFVGVALYLVLTGRTAYLMTFLFAMAIFSVIGFGLFSMLRETDVVSVLTERVQDRLNRSTESDDPSSGRFEIWQLAIELWIERPAFGYMFESFSRYAGDVDTPHQQYLEVLHKCGGIGLFFYLALLVSCLFATSRLLRMATRGSHPWYQLNAMRAMLVGLMVGNLTQPNLTFSLTGNMVFLLFGCLCSSRAVISACQTTGAPRAKSIRTAPVPLPRIAA
jgi:O-antigen ligase